MDILCKVCDRSISENQSEYMNYLTTLRKKDDKSLYIKNIPLIKLIWVKLMKD